MARSTKIYLVYIDSPYAIGESVRMPEAAFTVKHEALTYIKRTFSSTEAIRLYSGADGRNEGWKELDIPT